MTVSVPVRAITFACMTLGIIQEMSKHRFSSTGGLKGFGFGVLYSVIGNVALGSFMGLSAAYGAHNVLLVTGCALVGVSVALPLVIMATDPIVKSRITAFVKSKLGI